MIHIHSWWYNTYIFFLFPARHVELCLELFSAPKNFQRRLTHFTLILSIDLINSFHSEMFYCFHLNSSKSPAIQSMVDFSSFAVISHVSFCSLFFPILFYFHTLHLCFVPALFFHLFILPYSLASAAFDTYTIICARIIHFNSGQLIYRWMQYTNWIKVEYTDCVDTLYTLYHVANVWHFSVRRLLVVNRQSPKGKWKHHPLVCIQNINRFCVFVFVWVSQWTWLECSVFGARHNSFIISLIHGWSPDESKTKEWKR